MTYEGKWKVLKSSLRKILDKGCSSDPFDVGYRSSVSNIYNFMDTQDQLDEEEINE